MRLDRQISGYRRRVSKFYERDGISGKHKPLFYWDERTDTFNSQNSLVFQDPMEKTFIVTIKISLKRLSDPVTPILDG